MVVTDMPTPTCYKFQSTLYGKFSQMDLPTSNGLFTPICSKEQVDGMNNEQFSPMQSFCEWPVGIGAARHEKTVFMVCHFPHPSGAGETNGAKDVLYYEESWLSGQDVYIILRFSAKAMMIPNGQHSSMMDDMLLHDVPVARYTYSMDLFRVEDVYERGMLFFVSSQFDKHISTREDLEVAVASCDP